MESVDELFDKGAEAVFLAIGACKSMKMGMSGEDNPRVLDGVDVLYKINFEEEIHLGDSVAVVGGGNVAVDVARSALRVGVKNVSILYRRTREEMPAFDEEIEYAEEEGVSVQFLVAPVRVSTEADKIAVECIRMKLGEPDSSGRRRPAPIKGSEFTTQFDYLIVAIGQQSEVFEGFGVEADKRGRIAADSASLSCKRNGVFAGGDVVTGPATVIGAIQQGRIAAMNIDKYLGGDGNIVEQGGEIGQPNPCIGPIEGFSKLERSETPVLPVAKRLSPDSPEVECTLDEETARAEANRCLRCLLRLGISKAPEPPAKSP